MLTRSAAIPVLTQLLAVPATTRIRGIPTEVKLGEDDGMPRACALALDNIAQIRPELCTELITTLSPAQMTAVCAALGTATDC